MLYPKNAHSAPSRPLRIRSRRRGRSVLPPEAGDGPGTLIGNAGKNFTIRGTLLVCRGRKGKSVPLSADRGLTTSGGIGDNALLHAGGGVAQLGEHHVRNVGVEGSIPFSSTTFSTVRPYAVPHSRRLRGEPMPDHRVARFLKSPRTPGHPGSPLRAHPASIP